jgi:hypothetical protein
MSIYTDTVARSTSLTQLIDFAPSQVVRYALEPVLCNDCETYVPFGWIDSTLAPKCPKNIGATGVQYGHRIDRVVFDHLLDKAKNAVLEVLDGDSWSANDSLYDEILGSQA